MNLGKTMVAPPMTHASGGLCPMTISWAGYGVSGNLLTDRGICDGIGSVKRWNKRFVNFL